MRTLIRHARVVLPDEIAEVDVLLDGGTIASIGAPASTRADEVVDARGLHLIPGVVDDQVHFRDPGLTHKEDLFTASRACAKGGVTTFLEMPNTIPNDRRSRRSCSASLRTIASVRPNASFTAPLQHPRASPRRTRPRDSCAGC